MKNNQFEDILLYFSKSLLGKESEEDILWDVVKNCISKLGFVDCVIYIIEKGVLVQKAAHGPKNPKDKALYHPIEIALGSGITGHVAQTGKAEIINDTSKDPRYIEDDAARLSEICVPIACDDVIYGVIDCEHPEKNFFRAHHLKMLSAIASISAIKIKSVRASEEVLEKQEKLLKIREEMLELKLRALNSQLNPHFVFNSLNAIQYFVTSEKKKLALEYLSAFSRLVRFYLKQLGKDTVTLSNEIDMLHWYLKLQKLRYDNSFEYDISIEKEVSQEEAMIPALVVHILFENIIEQSMFSHQKNQHYTISFKISEHTVSLSIDHYIADSMNYSRPEYREGILKWQDEVELLNSVKNYNIVTKVTDDLQGNVHKRNITLNLPNLT
ncbi:histidine kinase [Flagellimonas baculiformis]|uniref:histidine kinase n=1 Tax=Flagellimonas baculiformis TaxID=3067310 RepID=UPI00296F6FC0|nr:histidine kinase [Muricauda sp. D6]